MNTLYFFFFPSPTLPHTEREEREEREEQEEPTVRQEPYSIQEEWFAKDSTVQEVVSVPLTVVPVTSLQEPIPFDESKLLELSDINRILDDHERLITDQELAEMASIRDTDIHEDIMKILIDIL